MSGDATHVVDLQHAREGAYLPRGAILNDFAHNLPFEEVKPHECQKT